MPMTKLEAQLAELGQPKYRAGQIFSWLHEKNVDDFNQMSNLSLAFRTLLCENFYIPALKIEKRLASKVDFAVKYLYRLFDGEAVESVLLKYKHGYSLCVSTQAGCKMGCDFCATGKGGFVRNLSPAEMLLQIEQAQKDNNIRISNVVLMGMGEPLDNLDNVLTFLEILTHEKGLNIGMRHISVSTCGLADKILWLAEQKPQFTLSVSLHAPNDDIRTPMMPVNKKWNVDTLLRACKTYIAKTNRRISFEYAMIDGVNDSTACAKELSQKLKGMLCHVNLIPVNPVGGTGYGASGKQRLSDFMNVLEKNGIQVTVRRTLGADIQASCGQLRNADRGEPIDMRQSGRDLL